MPSGDEAGYLEGLRKLVHDKELRSKVLHSFVSWCPTGVINFFVFGEQIVCSRRSMSQHILTVFIVNDNLTRTPS